MDAGRRQELLDAATAAGIVHAVNFNLRFYAHCHQARALVESGELGNVLLMHGRYLQDWLLNDNRLELVAQTGLGGDMRGGGRYRSTWLD